VLLRIHAEHDFGRKSASFCFSSDAAFSAAWPLKSPRRLSVRGKGRLALLAATFAGRSQPYRVARIPGGGRLCVDIRDRIQCLMWARAYEALTVQILNGILRPGDVFIDVGAHIGYFSVLAAVAVGEAGRVLAFEAEPELHDRLIVNLEPYDWASGKLAAVWDTPGNATLWRSDRDRELGWGSTVPVADEDRPTLTVPAVTLDSYLHSRPSSPVVVKVDAEGAELRVLKGGSDLLRSRVTACLVEANAVCLARDDARPSDLIDLLVDAGFAVCFFSSAGGGAPDMLLATREKWRLDSLTSKLVPAAD
jgi:FkbM family methyltransferase